MQIHLEVAGGRAALGVDCTHHTLFAEVGGDLRDEFRALHCGGVDTHFVGAGNFEVYLHGGRTPTGIDAVEWAARAAALGAGEILLTSMDRDGTREGFDLDLTRAVTQAVDVPVIASGGVGTLDHLADGVLVGGADAVLAASIFHFGEFSIAQAKHAMVSRGVRVRPAR